jgi:hypothetical protein
MNNDDWKMVFEALTAIGTIGAVIVALFNEPIKNRFYRVRLAVEVLDSRGELTTFFNNGIGTPTIFYHLRVTNLTKNRMAHKCRILLKEIQRFNSATNDFESVPLAVPPRFVWAPSDTSPDAVDFITEHILDFGYLLQHSTMFQPTETPRFNNFRGFIQANERVNYILEVYANNAKPFKVKIECEWDGQWNSNLQIMSTHFSIRKNLYEKLD